MDGAATQVDQLAQHLLPAQPHHLALSLTERYPPATDFRQTHSRLQYTTFVSGADRGLLLTRAYYEIVDEPETTAAAPADAPGRPDPKKAVNKVSFKDYRQNKQKKVSESPPDTGPAASADTNHSGASKNPEPRATGGIKEMNGNGKESKPTASAVTNGDRPPDLSPSERAKPLSNPLTDGRKRTADADSDSRPPKRTKSDNFTKPDASRQSQQKSGRSRDGGADVDERRDPKEPRHTAAEGTPNGRGLTATQKENKHASPSPRPATNGAGARSAEDRHPTPRAGDAGGRQPLPPLLSPLNLELDEERDGGARSPKKRPPEDEAGRRPKAAHKIQSSKAATTRPPKSPLHVPPLLSPTLPAVVEQELLARVKRTPSKGDSSQRGSQASESPGSAKKLRPVPDAEGARAKETVKEREKERPEKTEPRRLMVTLKFKRKYVKVVQQLLALPASHKEARRKERSISVDGTPPPSRKRPAPGDMLGESPSGKRPKPSADRTISARPLPPSTPLKTTAMSRAASSTSQALTPGDSTSLTPGGTGDRPSTSQGDVPASASALQQRSDRYQRLGTRLKHDRDAIVKPRLANGAASSGREPPPPPQLRADEKKLVAVLSIEMILSYMVSFRLLNQGRAADRKPANLQPWESLLLHFKELRGWTRHFRALEALAVQLHAFCLEQFAEALTTHDAGRVAPQLALVTRRRLDAWAEAYHGTEGVTDASMRVALGPWYSVEDAVRLVMPVLRRWAAREAVGYEMELTLPPAGGGGG